MKSTDPGALRAAQLLIDTLSEDADLHGQCETIDAESVWVHSPACLGHCEYACGAICVRRDEDGDVVEVEW